MIKLVLIMIVTAAVLVVTDDWVRAKWHPSEQQTPHYSGSNWLGKADKLVVKRVHLDVWVTDKYPVVMFYCVMSPCGRRSLFSIND